MNDDSKLRYKLRTLRRAKTWQLLVVLIPLLFIAATFLRLNNLGMMERREAVLKADKKGDDAVTQKKLVELQNFVSSHMNTNLKEPIYLENGYKRARDAAVEAATSATNASNPNSEIYKKASIECRARWQGGVASFRNDYVQCVVQRVQALHEGQSGTVKLDLPVLEKYRHSFAPPLFSLDFAGISILLCGLIIAIIVFRMIAIFSLQALLKYRQKRR